MTAIKKSSGFSLIEVMVALAVIGTVFVVFQVLLNTMFINRRVKHAETALRVASTKMEQMRNLTYETLPSSSVFSSAGLSSLPAGSGTLTVTSFNEDTKQVEVKVIWQETDSKAMREIKFTTLVTKGGI